MFKKLFLTITLLILTFVSIFSITYQISAAPRVPQKAKIITAYNPGRLIVRYKTSNKATQDSIAQKLGKNSQRKNLSTKLNISLVSSDTLKAKAKTSIDAKEISAFKSFGNIDTETQAAIALLKKDPNVLSVEPDFIVSTQFVPNDTRFSEQYGPHNTGQAGGTVDADIDAPEAWDITQGDSSVIVAVIDTGVDYEHPDLAANILRYDNRRQDPVGYDFLNEDDNPFDDHGHGTHVSGTIAATTNNARGVAGVCPNCKIMPIKFLGANGQGNISDAIESFQFAIDHGADIISNSWGGGPFSQTLQDLITAAHNQGIIVVFSAGNANSSEPFYPAHMDNVISVAATDNKDKKAVFSNHSNSSDNWIDVSAPGVNILSTAARPVGNLWCTLCTTSGYKVLSGTSMAAPHVAGLFGLLKAKYPSASIQDLEGHLMKTVDNIDSLNSGYEGLLGSGRINAHTALTTPITSGPYVVYSSHTIFDIQGNIDGFIQPGDSVALYVTTRNLGSTAPTINMTLSNTDPAVTIKTGTASVAPYAENASKKSKFVFDYSSAAPANQTILFTLTITDGSGYTKSFPVSVTTGKPPADVDYLRLLSPNDGEQATIGKPFTVKWTKQGTFDDIQMTIKQSNGYQFKYFAMPDPSKPNTFTYQNYPIFNGAGQYEVCLTGFQYSVNKKITDCSDGLFTALPPVKIISPNNGETLTIGKPATIKWSQFGDSSSRTGTLEITRIDGTTPSTWKYTVSNALPSDRNYTIQKLSAFSGPGMYTICITTALIDFTTDPVTGKESKDCSDKPFKLIALPVITTKSLPDAKVGKLYKALITVTDLDINAHVVINTNGLPDWLNNVNCMVSYTGPGPDGQLRKKVYTCTYSGKPPKADIGKSYTLTVITNDGKGIKVTKKLVFKVNK